MIVARSFTLKKILEEFPLEIFIAKYIMKYESFIFKRPLLADSQVFWDNDDAKYISKKYLYEPWFT